MFIPLAPIINKTIVYSDTILSLKDLGNNLKICTINNINEYSLENCLKKIIESNPDVFFNTIQYSKKDKKLYLYTDKEISKKSWEESQFTEYKPLTNSAQILEEIDNILNQEKIKDTDCISLYDISKLIKSYSDNYEYIKDRYENYFDDVLYDEYYDSSIIVYDFDYKKSELTIGFQYSSDNYDKIIFTKQNEDLFIVKSESIHSQEILEFIGNGLSEVYDELIKFKDFINERNYQIKPVNSNFILDITCYGISLYTQKDTYYVFNKEFEISYSNYKNEYKYKCNSLSILNELKGKENEIFKRIFIKIDDCPNWTKQTLYETRQKQLEEEKRLEEKQLKKQKILNLKRKFLPCGFFKNKSHNF